jgi:hypothetical protein
LEKKEFSPGWRLMPNTTVFLLDIIDSNSLHEPVSGVTRKKKN